MKFKLYFLLFIFCLTILPYAEAYPWVSKGIKKQDQSEKQWGLEWDIHTSYFVKGEVAGFSGFKWDYHDFTIDVDTAWNYSFLENQHYFRLSELSFIFPFISDKWKMHIGFRDVLWSEADRYWNYGLWQPRYLIDLFRPVQMGIPGIYLDYKGDSSLLFLFSYFYLPDIIIYPKVISGDLVSRNPFFISSLSGYQWDVDSFKLFEVKRFLNPLMAFQVKHAVKQAHISFSYAYKPVNQLQYSVVLKARNLSNRKKEEKLTIQDFKYSLMFHHIASLEGEVVLNKSFSIYTSLFFEKPEEMPSKGKWISDNFEPHVTFSLLSYFYEKHDEISQTVFTLGYTKTIESESGNLLTEDLEDTFGRGFDWKEAISASMEYQNQSVFHGVLFRLRGNYALDNGFYSLALENHVYFSSHIQLYVSGDVLFQLSDRKFKKNSSSIEKYSDLSRLTVGAKYVF